MLRYKEHWRTLPHPVHGKDFEWSSFGEFRVAWKLTWGQMAWRGFWLAGAYMVPDIFWFSSLSMTSVAAATTIFNSSTAFVVLFSIFLLGERPSLIKFGAAILAVASSAMVSFADNIAPSHGSNSDTSSSKPSNPVLGGLFAFLGAVLYGLYEVVYKRFGLVTGENDPLPMVIIVAGLMGVGNTLGLAPFIPLLDWTGLEEWHLPVADKWPNFVIMSAMLAVFIVSLMTSIALLPSPTYVAVGITLTVPGSLVLDAVLHGASYSWPFLVGSLGVILSFGLIVAKEHHPALLSHRWL
ncbi:uncharacterized protein AMSG_11773 [Thecamonas trahens ATCC 50062]|uniref:EamA domain-containing protein n=1 Tax=Thecamonas trahens ATCC 50062 TaxID=461836 RepID=A0A0L0D776_THETB|nr:hypothetical protein AMSG_11773 [Thecamonas trahens ATCC 50062]KNC47143.1 hypothetical protein AMSG_11773 [Thecamonas trahens ATCC 50062]|eukprot:XP_013760006.1 hypothetical protein AMSG_11773 [Thecamonas trahens ATCC 50062]